MDLSELAAAWPWLFPVLAAGVGLLFGSFFNVVIYRLPLMMEAAWKRECELLLAGEDAASIPQHDDKAASFNLAFPHSHCPHCKAAVAPWQNIPVVSYLLLRGRCASCGNRISLRYPLIELVTGALAFAVIAHYGPTLGGLAVLFFCWALLVLTCIDIDHQLLPDQITLPLLWAGLLFNATAGAVPLGDAVWGAAAGYLSLWTVYWLFKLVTGKEGMGYGDFKLLAALGAWMGWQMLPLVILLSSVVGAVIGSIMIALTRSGHGKPIPFGPYLAGAGLITFFWGEALLNGYLQFAGLK